MTFSVVGCVNIPMMLTVCLKIEAFQKFIIILFRQLVYQQQVVPVEQWFLTGVTRTSWGCQTPKQGVRSTNIFRHTRAENFKDVLSIAVSETLSEAKP